MSNFLDTKTLYPANSVTKEFWEKFQNQYKIYGPPSKTQKKLKISTLKKSTNPSPQRYGSFNMTMNEDSNENEAQDRLMQINIEQLQSWSPDNMELYKKFMELGFQDELVNKEYLQNFYKELRLEDLNIQKIDKETTLFKNLEVLTLSRNNIQVLENLPPNIKEVYVFYNEISFLRTPKAYESLVYLGLGYNKLTDSIFDTLHQGFPKLMGLDLSYNEICGLDNVVSSLTFFKNLKMLNLFGNPVTLVPHYRSTILEELKMLKVFDNEKVNQEVSYKMKPKQQTSVITSSVVKEVPKDDKSRGAETLRGSAFAKNDDIPDFAIRSGILDFPSGIDLKFIVNVCTLEEVQGLNFNDQYNTTEAPAENYQTNYWISCNTIESNFDGKDQKVLFDSCTVENENARLDFASSITSDVYITPETRDYFSNGLIIKVHKREPILEQGEPDAEKKPLIKDNEIQMEEKVLGVCKVDLKKFLEPKADSKAVINQKYRLWPANYLEIPEFLYPVNDEFKKIKKIIEKLPKPEEEKQEVLALDPKKAGKGGKDAKKEVKKEAKKDTKKGGKGKTEVIEKKVVALLDWPVDARDKILIEEGNKLLDCIPNYLLAVKVELSMDSK